MPKEKFLPTPEDRKRTGGMGPSKVRKRRGDALQMGFLFPNCPRKNVLEEEQVLLKTALDHGEARKNWDGPT